LTAIYAAYLLILTRLPPQEHEGVEDLQKIPRAIVKAPRTRRTAAILSCFLIGGGLIYFTAEPFLGSLLALATAVGIPSFIVVQWLAPVVSEFPELASTFYFARQTAKAPMALMNIVSSNINQWTLLIAMLPVVLSISAGSITSIDFDREQQVELLLTLAQAFVGLAILLNMRLEWWEASLLLLLYLVQVVFANTSAHSPTFAFLAGHVRIWITYCYFSWAAVSVVVTFIRYKAPPAFRCFQATWRSHVAQVRV